MKRIYFAALAAFVFHGCGSDVPPPPLHPLDQTGVIVVCSHDDPVCVLGGPSPIIVSTESTR